MKTDQAVGILVAVMAGVLMATPFDIDDIYESKSSENI